MREPWRSAYLQAMGVDLYVARRPLPGAGPSLAPLWDPQALAQQVPSQAREPDVVAPTVERQSKPIAVQRPALDVVSARREPASEPQAPVERRSANPVPRFALQVVRAQGVLVLDEGPERNADRIGYRHFVTNLVFALWRSPVKVDVDLFLWPMVRNPSVDQSERAARESLGAYIERQCTQHGCDTLLLLGATAQNWVATERRILRAESGWHCIGNGAAKRALWQQLAGQLAQ